MHALHVMLLLNRMNCRWHVASVATVFILEHVLAYQKNSIKRSLNRLSKSGFAVRAKTLEKVSRSLKGGLKLKMTSDPFSVVCQKLDELLPLKETVPNIERSIQLMSDKYDEMLTRLAAQEKDTKEIRKRLERLEQNTCASDDATKRLEADLNELEWRSRKLNLEIHGVGVSEGENLLAKVNSVASMIDVRALEATDVAAIHRLPCKFGKTPGIIVRYIRQSVRDEWLHNRSKLREKKSNLFIQENLTSQSRQLLREAKEWAKENGYKYAWHKNGKILLRKGDGDSVLVVRHRSDFPV